MHTEWKWYKLFLPIGSCETLLAHIQPTVKMHLVSACITCKRGIDKGLVIRDIIFLVYLNGKLPETNYHCCSSKLLGLV